MLRLFKEVEKYVDSISKTWLETINQTTGATKGMTKNSPGSGRLGLASVSKTEATVGAVASAAMFAGWFTYKATPNTMDAVTQRISADSYAGLSGMSSRKAITQANAAVGGGATSAMGPTMAAQSLFYSGYTASSKSSQTIMGQLAGMSAMSGMSNQQAAGAAGSMNGMNFLRMGVNIRDSKGNLKPMDQIINQVYNFMYRGRKITKEQAATVYNPNSKGYADISLIAGGDPNLTSLIQSGIVSRASASSAKAFSSAMQSKDPNSMLNVMGVDQSSPIRSNFRGSSAQAKMLQSTEQGLVGGYNDAVRTNAMLTSGFADLLNAMGPVTKAFMTLKGALQTFPNTGGVGGTLSGIANTAVNAGEDYLAYKAASKFSKSRVGKSLFSRALGIGKKVFPKLGKLALLGAEEAGLGALEVGSGGLATGLVAAAETGMIASQVPGIFKGGWGGGPSNYGNLGTGTGDHSLVPGSTLPVPPGTPINSPFGPRKLHGRNYHYGMDLGVQSGTPISSFADGVVSTIGSEAAGYGNYVEVNHGGGVSTVYGHLKSITTTRGKKVKAGEKIALSGGALNDPGHGSSDGAHLHFEVKNKGVRINPAPYLNAHLVNLPKGYDPTKGYDINSAFNTGKYTGGAIDMAKIIGTTITGSTAALNSRNTTSSSIKNLKSQSLLSKFLLDKGSIKNELSGELAMLNSQDVSSDVAGLGSFSGDNSSINMFGNTVAHNIGKNKALAFTKGVLSITPGVILGTGSSKKWAQTLLYKLGYPSTNQNMAALTTWAAFEGGQWHNPAHFNPLNTTQKFNGSTSMNKVGVQSYKNWDDGYAATVKTLKNGKYNKILGALSKGKSTNEVLKEVNHSPWGTHVPGYGGPNPGVNIGTLGVGGPMPSVNVGSLGGASHSSANINLSMSVVIQNASVNETERLVHIVANRLKAELQKSPYSLTSLGSGL